MTDLSIVVAVPALALGVLWIALALRRRRRGAFWAGLLFTTAALAGVVGAASDPSGLDPSVHARDLSWALLAFVASAALYKIVRLVTER